MVVQLGVHLIPNIKIHFQLRIGKGNILINRNHSFATSFKSSFIIRIILFNVNKKSNKFKKNHKKNN